MKRSNRTVYKTSVTDKPPIEGTILHRLKHDYIDAIKLDNKRLVYRVNAKQKHRLKSRKSIREYLKAIEDREQAERDREMQQFKEELSKL